LKEVIMKRLASLILVLALVVSLFGCATTKAPKGVAPAWINQTGIMGDVILGVGTAPKMYNPALQRREAAHQARVEIARILRTKVQAMQESYANEVRDLMTDAGQSEFLSASVSREVTDALLVGVQVPKYYTDPQTGILYAQAVLSKDNAINGILENMKRMSDKQRWIIEQHKEQAMGRMDKAIKDAFGE
jgi:hypothetical protein